ncbi:MAG: hypothetical protein SF052_22370 [Bacteroidia bacterium]|nr:hypothetical protein [Bacteroidia bacterium]
MTTFSVDGIDPWVIKKILSFLNKAKTAEDIIGPSSPVIDDPDNGGKGYTIGEAVANRILEKRKSLRPVFFKDVSQLQDIEGFGEDKFADLVYTFRQLSADEFVAAMYKNLIGENWQLEHFSSRIMDTDNFRETVNDPYRLRKFVTEMLSQVAQKTLQNPGLSQEFARGLLANTYLETYDIADYARYAWALWFYRVDADNWFGFDQVRDEVDRYLSTYWSVEDRIDLHFFKGYKSSILMRSNSTDLPVTVCHAEQTISIWRAELFD